MQLHELQVERKYKKPRVGRGGKRGTTSGKGQKGQKSRSGHRIRPAERDLIQRLPKLRGYRNKPKSTKLPVINVGDLEKMQTVPQNVKILGSGEIKKAITVPAGVAVSKSAREKIEKAGGTIH